MTEPQPPLDDKVRPHVFDGIQEYDKRMPNWWLFTLYSSIAFAIGYWVLVEQFKTVPDGALALETELLENKYAAAQKSAALNDDSLWTMSHDPVLIAAGKTTFDTACASCHRPDLMGMIGPNLRDQTWVHGGAPLTLVKVVEEGVLAKGMPPWSAVLGKKKITEVVAYILSFHQKGEPEQIAPWVPTFGAPAGAAPADAPAAAVPIPAQPSP